MEDINSQIGDEGWGSEHSDNNRNRNNYDGNECIGVVLAGNMVYKSDVSDDDNNEGFVCTGIFEL